MRVVFISNPDVNAAVPYMERLSSSGVRVVGLVTPWGRLKEVVGKQGAVETLRRYGVLFCLFRGIKYYFITFLWLLYHRILRLGRGVAPRLVLGTGERTKRRVGDWAMGRTLNFRTIGGFVSKYGIPWAMPRRLNDPNVVSRIREVNPDIIFVTSLTQKVGREIINIPKYGCVNIHSSLLPRYRGLASSFWALYNGEQYSGVTFHLLKKDIDAGNIIFQVKTRIKEGEGPSELDRRLISLGAEYITEVVDILKSGVKKFDPVPDMKAPLHRRPNRNQRKFLMNRIKTNRKSMRTLLITNDYPPVISGIGTVFYHIWRYFSEGSHLIIAPRIKGALSWDRDRGMRATVRYPHLNSVHTLAKASNQLFLSFVIIMLIVFKRVRYLHCGTMVSSGSLGILFKKFFKIRYSLWVYADETSNVYMKGRLKKVILDRIIFNAHRIITNSGYTTREFMEYGIPEERIVEILPGVDCDHFYPQKRSSDIIEKYDLMDKKVLLTVSRLVERKGHDLVLKALPIVMERYPQVIYLIVGDGPDSERLKRISSDMGLDERVIFAGRVTEEELPRFYNLGDIYVMPNRKVAGTTDSIEGFGISFIEANACGKPVIGGRSGGAIEAVVDGETGFIIDPSDPNELAGRINQLLEDGELARRLGDAGRKRVLKYFSWQARAEKMRRHLT